MKSLIQPSLVILLLAQLLLAGCEKPRPRAVEESSAEKSLPAAPAESEVSSPIPATAEPGAPVAVNDEPAPESELPAEPPLLSVAMEDGKVMVSGALRSKIQQERIVETLKREFPDNEVVSELKVEYHRNPVGWGNRVADEFLVPFLHQVKDAKIVYRDQVVTLEGTVKSAGEERLVAETAIDVFSGDDTKDVESKLKVASP